MSEFEQQDSIVEGEQGQSGHGSPADNGRQSKVPDGYVPHHVVGGLREEVRNLKAAMAEYQKFGDPKSLAEMKTRYEELTKGTKFTPSETSKLREEMFAVLPELRAFQADREARQEAFLGTSENKVNKWLGELGLEVNDHNHLDLQELIAGRIARDKNWLRRFQGGDASVLDEAYADVKKRFGLGAAKRLEAARVQSVKHGGPKPPINPQAKKEQPGTPTADFRSVMADANDRAFALIGQGESE